MTTTRRALMFLGLGAAGGAGMGALFRKAGGARATPPLLRPPGALPEPRLAGACIRCGQCVEACPFGSILLAGSRAGTAVGTPFVDPRRVPCTLCRGYDTLRCTHACPTGALHPVEDPRKVRMGTAVVLQETCLAFNRVVCRSCWHACPFPNEAIRFDDLLRPVVNGEACTGCGLCTRACPTEATSIPIRPRDRTAFAVDLDTLLGIVP